jgi:hypothetical protein
VRKAASAALYVLTDNAGVSRKDANTFAGELAGAGLDTEVTHEASGYRFWISSTQPERR